VLLPFNDQSFYTHHLFILFTRSPDIIRLSHISFFFVYSEESDVISMLAVAQLLDATNYYSDNLGSFLAPTNFFLVTSRLPELFTLYTCKTKKTFVDLF